MKNILLIIIAFLIKTIAIAQKNIEQNSIKLSTIEINAIANSLAQQKVLTNFGKEELVRYATNKPLLIYKNYKENDLDEVNCNQYLLEEFFDILPGRENKNKEYLSALQKVNDEKKNELAGQQIFLNNNFPTRTHIINFLHTCITFNLYEGHQSYVSFGTKLAKAFGTYFYPNINANFLEKTVEFSVSYDKDTKILQKQRVNVVKPFLKWLTIFKTAGLLDKDEVIIDSYYADGENISSDVDHLKVVDEIKKIIKYRDLIPFYKTKQSELLTELVATGFLDTQKKDSLFTAMKPNELLNGEKIVASSKNHFSLNRAKEVAPYDFMTWNYYGTMEIAAIKKVYETVIQKASKLLNFTFSGLEVHKIATDNEEQLISSANNRQFYVYVKINNVLYKEAIKEVQGHNWVRAQNFQFLNHFLEDQNDEKRFFITKTDRITGYEPNEPETIYFALLNEKQEKILRNKYTISNLNVCYTGEPGDYNYDVSYGYYDYNDRLSKKAIVEFLENCKSQKISKILNIETEKLYATFRELNPKALTSIFTEFPEVFTFEKNNGAESFLTEIERKLQEIQPNKTVYFTDFLQEYKVDPAVNFEKLFISFKLKNKQYDIVVDNEEAIWENNFLLNFINKALRAENIVQGVFEINIKARSLDGNNFILLTNEQKLGLEKNYPELIKKN